MVSSGTGSIIDAWTSAPKKPPHQHKERRQQQRRQHRTDRDLARRGIEGGDCPQAHRQVQDRSLTRVVKRHPEGDW